MTLLSTIVAIIVTIVVSGQLIVASVLKLRGFGAYMANVGSIHLALLLIGADLALCTWCVVGRPYGQVMWLCVAAFFILGAAHRTRVVLSPTRVSCVCAHPGAVTAWPDVASNVVIAATALLLGVMRWQAPAWFVPITIVAEAVFVGTCLKAVYRPRRFTAAQG